MLELVITLSWVFFAISSFVGILVIRYIYLGEKLHANSVRKYRKYLGMFILTASILYVNYFGGGF